MQEQKIKPCDICRKFQDPCVECTKAGKFILPWIPGDIVCIQAEGNPKYIKYDGIKGIIYKASHLKLNEWFFTGLNRTFCQFVVETDYMIRLSRPPRLPQQPKGRLFDWQ